MEDSVNRVLITGASGFIGRRCLAPLQARGYEINALSHNSTTGSADAGVSWHRIDLLETGMASRVIAEIRPTHLLHIGWIATPGVFWSSAENLRWSAASVELFRAFGASGGRRAVGVGSCAEYDGSYGICHEDETPLRPSTVYGLSKLAAHAALRAAATAYGFSTAWARVFFPYGPGEPPAKLLSSVVRATLKGESIDCSHGRQVRDFLFVTDVAAALAALLDSTLEGAFNVGSGEPLSLRDAVLCATRFTGRPELVQFGRRHAAHPDEPPVLVASTRKLQSLLNWAPEVDLSTGMARTVDYWRGVLFPGAAKQTDHSVEGLGE